MSKLKSGVQDDPYYERALEMSIANGHKCTVEYCVSFIPAWEDITEKMRKRLYTKK